MSIATTIHELTSYLSWFPEYSYVRFFGRVLSYDAVTGILQVQELPSFFVETIIVEPTDSQVSSSSSSSLPQQQSSKPESESPSVPTPEPRPLPVARIFLTGLPDPLPQDDDDVYVEGGYNSNQDSGISTLMDVVNNYLVVDVMGRIRSMQPVVAATTTEAETETETETTETTETTSITNQEQEQDDIIMADQPLKPKQKPKPKLKERLMVDLDFVSIRKLDDQSLFDIPTSEIVKAVLLKTVFMRESLRMKRN